MTARRARSTVTGFGLLAGACLVALLGAPPAGATDGGLPDAMPGDRILVSHRADDAVELHVVDPDSGERTVLTSGETDTGGTWSPDGRHVAFLRVEAGGDGLWVVPVAGGPARRLADGGRSPSWSPDGTRIVHSPSTEATPLPLAITDLAGATTPVPGTAGGIEPAWSPSGDEIAYVDPARDRALVLVRTDGTDRTVTPGPASGPVWSPDADRVAYVERTDDGDRLRMIDGAASASYAYRNPFTRIQRLDYSPDGSAVAVTAARDGEPLRVWTVRVSDGIVRQVGEDDRGEDRSPSWSASAGRIAFSRTADASAADQPSDVLVIPATGGAARQVTDSGRDLTADFGPGLALRRSGRSRIATAAALAGTLPAAEAIVVARADAYPDALAGGPLAAALGAPILLTGSDGLDPILPAEIDRLGARTAYLLGGTGALSAAVAPSR
jgi:Tol biopolymer transport system component